MPHERATRRARTSPSKEMAIRGRRDMARIPIWWARFGSASAFIKKSSNPQLLSLWVTVVVAMVSGIWAVVIYVWPAHEAPMSVCAEQGVAIRGNVSGSAITNRVSGGTATAELCVDSAKK